MKSLTLEKHALIMGTAQLKEELHQYVDRGDKRLLHMMQAIAKAYFEEDYTSPGDPMSIEEYKERIREAKSNIAVGHFTTQEDLEREMEQW
ncbi:hypothetical protein N7E81_02915 [Reichenbachiella carrageenanivorans]|uniref:Addiction module component n=1 Tax=Reichenbachiella carrageenanivorans TaxID=2979869 RepID=A0ABY6D1L2_9BACT|nr:hypothetical protein [Reichenbachiella carrageenanivorans]UXX80056.1 hypothetical protein N7E81_02915 [Reichenbachiella carrageenanivorans]